MSLDVLFKQAVTDALEDALNKHLVPILQRLHLPDTIPAEDASLNREQAAKYLGLSKSTLAIMASEKRGPLYYKIGRSVVYRRADLARFLEDNQCLVGRRGRPPLRPVAVATNGSIHGRKNPKKTAPPQSTGETCHEGGGISSTALPSIPPITPAKEALLQYRNRIAREINPETLRDKYNSDSIPDIAIFRHLRIDKSRFYKVLRDEPALRGTREAIALMTFLSEGTLPKATWSGGDIIDKSPTKSPLADPTTLG